MHIRNPRECHAAISYALSDELSDELSDALAIVAMPRIAGQPFVQFPPDQAEPLQAGALG